MTELKGILLKSKTVGGGGSLNPCVNVFAPELLELMSQSRGAIKERRGLSLVAEASRVTPPSLCLHSRIE